MSRWLRINEDCIDHPKVLKLPEALRWQWVALLCVASKNQGILPPIDDVALCLRVTEVKAAEFITKLVKAKLIDKEGDQFVPHNWKKRQFKSDLSTDRVKKHRDSKRNVSPTVSGNVSEPLHETPPEQSRAETDSEQSRAGARELDEMGLKQEGLLRAAFLAECLGRPSAPDMSIIKTWLLDGITVATINSVVPPILRRKQDMKSLVYCDAAVREAHSKAPANGLQVGIDMSSWVVVIEGTLEETCWQQYTRETTGRPMFICDVMHEGRMVRGIKKPTAFPPGFNDFGERIPPSAEDAA